MKIFLMIMIVSVGAIIGAGEPFCESYKYTIQSIGVLGTLFAVLVSLWLANRKYRPSNISLKLDFYTQHSNDERGFSRKFLALRVDNFETLPIYLNNELFLIFNEIQWPIDHYEEYTVDDLCDEYRTYIDTYNHTVWNPLEDEFKKYPVIVKEGLSEVLVITPLDWLDIKLKEKLSTLSFWKIRWLKVLIFLNLCPKWFIKIKLYNETFSVVLSKEVKKHILELFNQEGEL